MAKAQRILILIGRHLCTAPRPQKEARALAEAGHEVTVMGYWMDPLLIARDKALLESAPYRFIPLMHGGLRYHEMRLRSRLAGELFKRKSKFSPDLLGFLPKLMLKRARQFGADLTIAHSEGSLWVVAELLKKGLRVGVDFEDWFSKDLPEAARRTRPIEKLEELEKLLLGQGSYRVTTSKALAAALAKHYQVAPPTVIYNTFAFAERGMLDGKAKDRDQRTGPSLHWFSQSIGPGRGLEELFDALALLGAEAPETHVRGTLQPAYEKWFEKERAKAPEARLFVHDTVPNAELLSRIAEHDIGLALEQATPESRNCTITNKLFQYMQAGLAIIATPTAGQQEVFDEAPGIGRMVPHQDPVKLAEAILYFSSNAKELSAAKSASLRAVEDRFCWERQQPILIEAAEKAQRSQTLL